MKREHMRGSRHESLHPEWARFTQSSRRREIMSNSELASAAATEWHDWALWNESVKHLSSPKEATSIDDSSFFFLAFQNVRCGLIFDALAPISRSRWHLCKQIGNNIGYGISKQRERESWPSNFYRSNKLESLGEKQKTNWLSNLRLWWCRRLQVVTITIIGRRQALVRE